MARRALLTEGEREALLDPDSKENPYIAVSRVRNKIREELPRDVEILQQHAEEYDSDLLQELQNVVYGDENRDKK